MKAVSISSASIINNSGGGGFSSRRKSVMYPRRERGEEGESVGMIIGRGLGWGFEKLDQVPCLRLLGTMNSTSAELMKRWRLGVELDQTGSGKIGHDFLFLFFFSYSSSSSYSSASTPPSSHLLRVLFLSMFLFFFVFFFDKSRLKELRGPKQRISFCWLKRLARSK